MSAEHVHNQGKQDSGKLPYVLLLLIALGAAGGGWLWRSRVGASANSPSSQIHRVLHLDTFVLNLSDRDDRAYLQVWADTFANIVADLSGTSTTCEVLQELATEKPEVENSLFAHGTISGAIAGAFSFRIPPSTAGELMRTKEEGSESREPASALKEIFERAAGQVSSHLGLNHAVQDVSNQAPSDLESAQSYWFRLDSAPACLLELHMDARCVAALQSRSMAKDTATEESPMAAEARSPEENLEVLKHVELAVSMRFGSRRMLLKDILDLSAGSVVELDQQIQQPVDLLLDGRLIARGEVVVVEGNYGLRVTEVLADAAD